MQKEEVAEVWKMEKQEVKKVEEDVGCGRGYQELLERGHSSMKRKMCELHFVDQNHQDGWAM